MSNFPNSYCDSPTALSPSLDDRGNEALLRLNERGFIVATGLNPYYARAIAVMGQQEHIREYCPKDETTARFGTQASTEKWLNKGGGRAVFLLLEQANDANGMVGERLQGYGWTGVEPCEELPDNPITSAYRLGAGALHRNLAADFIQTVVSGTHALYAPDDGIGLETWKSNRAAGIYQKVGFILQDRPEQPQELRPTLDPDAEDRKVLDTRLYMTYPNELFVSNQPGETND